jgi:F-type H+-transporting ATPase subunit alpha
MEVIKQGVNAPLNVVKQIVLIYAGTRGYLDDIPVNQVRPFEAKLNDALDSTYADFVRLLDKEKAMTDAVETALKNLLVDFKKHWTP